MVDVANVETIREENTFLGAPERVHGTIRCRLDAHESISIEIWVRGGSCEEAEGSGGSGPKSPREGRRSPCFAALDLSFEDRFGNVGMEHSLACVRGAWHSRPWSEKKRQKSQHVNTRQIKYMQKEFVVLGTRVGSRDCKRCSRSSARYFDIRGGRFNTQVVTRRLRDTICWCFLVFPTRVTVVRGWCMGWWWCAQDFDLGASRGGFQHSGS